VVDEHQTELEWVDENTPIAALLQLRKEKQAESQGLLTPDYVAETGVAGKRPMIDGIALPFSLGKEADTASMVTLTSTLGPGSRPVSPVPPTKPAGQSPAPARVQSENSGLNATEGKPKAKPADEPDGKESALTGEGSATVLAPAASDPPGSETFDTAAGEPPKAT
jgi:hypothetical protein